MLFGFDLELILQAVLDSNQTRQAATVLDENDSRTHLLEDFHDGLKRETRVYSQRRVVDIPREINNASTYTGLDPVKRVWSSEIL
jgi:predicted metal-dependent hydrolase